MMGITIIGSSSVMVSVSGALCKAASFDKNVLLLGETGTGKDLAARKIHELSPCRAFPFIPINCSNLSDGLFESELFGHAKGAFTGAVREKSGLLDVAENGTVFLDEIGELPLHLQAKILRLLDKKESRRIGATQTRTLRVRFIFATNRNLHASVLEGTFRKDLYYRINVVRIQIPALRERKEDIPSLVNHFIEQENLRSDSHKALTQEALEKLSAYDFPGNVRELENVIERSFVFSEGDLVTARDIRLDPEPIMGTPEVIQAHIKSTLEQCRWNKTKTARRLGKSRRQLYRILEKYELTDNFRKVVL
jgi:two-component system NtrC family response regulator/two-component system response regulator AtoC